MTMKRSIVCSMILMLTAAGHAQQPQIQNAKLTSQPATSLSRDVAAIAAKATDPTWVAWRVPAIDGERNSCCWYSDQYNSFGVRGCFVEPSLTPDSGLAAPRPQMAPATGPVQLEAGTGLVILVRFVEQRMERLRTLSDDCPLDAGGRAVYWIDQVNPADSVTYLASMATDDRLTPDARQRFSRSAVSAIGYHRDPSAVDTLLKLAKLTRETDTSVRAEAMYWVAQRAGQRLLGDVTAIIDNDPEASVKKRAVAGLAQLPDNAGVPLLIQFARTSKHLAVRQEAIRWLGQSKDARAIGFLEEIIRRD